MSATIPPPEAILFDWDDTLVDNWRAIADALNAAYTAFGMPAIDIEETKRRATRSMRESFPVIFGADWSRARDIFVARFADCHISHLQAKPGAARLLDDLRGAGLPLAVVSNKQGAFLRDEAAHLDWNPYFGALVGAGDAVADKPDPAAVVLALTGAKIAASKRTWLVGDSAVDMACAAAAGCTGICIGLDRADLPPFDGESHRVTTLDALRMLVSAVTGSI